ncbi:MAG TPA: phosphatase PAP2 family protein [Sphingomicrobium sp.]|nr:phosphatase PAP2 family protein [Sphingomicrobium sp.]
MQLHIGSVRRPVQSWLGTEDCSTAQVLGPSVGLTAMMLIAGISTANFAGLSIGALLLPYFSSAGACTLLTFLIVLFLEVVRFARLKAPDPLFRIRERFLPRLPFLMLPALIFPAFLVGFTASKSAIPFLVGYSWDSFWWRADLLIFRTDPWQITHALFGSRSLWFWQWFYSVGWGAAFFFSAAAIPLYASRKFVTIFFTAMFSTWFFGGFVLAYAFSAAGPVFAHMFDPALAMRFARLRAELGANVGDGPIGLTQRYLAGAVHNHIAVMGGGISAMPSMHLAAAAIYVIASRGTKWFIPSLLFWLIIFIASAYFGYHYWVDGLAGAAVAWICWKVAAGLVSKMTESGGPALMALEPS